MERKTKTVFQLDSPFTQIQWPEINPEQQDTLLELLCSILSPIGKHRLKYAAPSKGKRDKKRKRKEAKLAEVPLDTSKPPVPNISSFVVVGLNSIVRHLESSSKASKPEQTRDYFIEVIKADELAKPQPSTHFSAIFVPISTQPSILNAQLPRLIATASKEHQGLPATRLVQLPKDCDARLCEALGLSRVSFIGLLEGAPHSKALVELVRKSVSEIGVPWLQEAKKGKYLPVNINAIETLAPPVKDKEKKIS
ncbi:hypothetical protein LHYA1_G003469 [Lachnellula hyalina]|uniref:Uncharacterized protein n=1 Tax=Lachnellula hyalina TaxID=1316788 RepID=A0A8H8R518_9HELO|nr:uncharacterized protein LHYA1_G003469 [Lachnellula hyalina]TVY28478.1 hypothetical protein LHYA1_G003469 [Lachnellula hyalina]